MELCFVKFVVWLLIVSVGSEGKVAGRATCESTGPEEPARVTCHYRENVVEARDVRAVSLLRDTGGKEEKVVECDRFLNNGLDCTSEAGYKLNGTISDQMIINIPRAQTEHQGTYYCELRIQQTEVQMGSCDLQYKVKVVGRATCESTGLGEPARVTCHYRENVVEARDVSAVSLLRDTGGKEEKVVECDRFLNNGFDCTSEAGYKVNGTISDQMIINIPRARPEHQGTYYCELVIQQTEFQIESCDMQFKEPDDAATSTPPPEQDSDDQLKGDTCTSNTITWLIAAIVFFVIMLVITLPAAVLFVCKKLQRRRNRRQQDTDVDKLGDGIVRFLLASNISNDNGPCTINFSQFPYIRTEVEASALAVSSDNNVSMAAIGGSNTRLSYSDFGDSLLDVSIGDNVGMVAEGTPSRTEDN